MELSERRQLILKLAIQEYVDSGDSVASGHLVVKYGLAYSPATVRNELAALEEQGLLTHLHTSAGRVPTDAGYRYFVENLMDRAALSAQEQRTIQHQFYQVRGELDQWIHLAAAVLARSTQNVAIVTPPCAYTARYKHIELIAIHDTVILLVLVLHDGTIRQQSLTLDHAMIQDELSRVAAHLNTILTEADVAMVEAVRRGAHDVPLSELEILVVDTVIRSMQQREGQINEEMHHDGLLEMLQHLRDREFNQVGRVREVLEILDGRTGLAPLIPQALASDGVQVIIGGEHGLDKMRDYSVILARYGQGRNLAGVVGLFGPTRMAYPRSISTVRYISTVMSELLAELYGALS